AGKGEARRRGDRARGCRDLAMRARPARGAAPGSGERERRVGVGTRRPARIVAEVPMRYTAILDGEERLIEITPRENGHHIVIDTEVLDVDAVHMAAW